MSIHEVEVLREVVKKLVPMIAGRGVRVTQMGAQAFVTHNPKTGKTERVNIPHIPDNADATLMLAIQGFIDHEVGHVLDTDWKAVGAGRDKGIEIAEEQKIDRDKAIERIMFLSNVCEDPFVERCMAKRFPGAAWNLDKLYDVFVNRLTLPALKKAENDAERLSVLIVPIVRSIAGQKFFTDFLDTGKYLDEPLVKAFVDRITPLLRKEIATIKTSWDSLDCATQLYHILYPPPPPPPPPAPSAPPSAEPGKGDGKSEEPGDGKGTSEKPEEDDDEGAGGEMSETPPETPPADEEESDDAPKDDAEGEEAEPEKATDDGLEPDDAAEEEGDEPVDEPDAETAPAEEERKPEGDEKDVKGGSDASGEDKEETGEGEPAAAPESEEAEGTAEAEAEASPFDGLDVPTSKDIAEVVSEMITDAATRETRGADYRIYTKEWDVIEPLEIGAGYKTEWLEQLDAKTRHMVAPMQKEIERMMAARSQVVKVPGFRSGRLHGGSLTRLRFNDDRVFRRIQENHSTDTAISLLVDNSGSMGGGKTKTAMAAAYALSQTLERLKIKHEVIGFTDKGITSAHSTEINREAARIGTSFSRTEPIYMPIYKGYDERLTADVRARFAKAFGYADFLRQNVDGECVEIASHRLKLQKEPRKVLLVFSDGSPHCHTHHHRELHSSLHHAVANCKKMGIEIVGIGIETDVVKTYYPKNIVLNDVNDLPKTVMGELKRILLSPNK